MSYGLNLNDAEEILKRKLLINKMSLVSLEQQIEYSKKSTCLHVITMKTAEEKIKLIKKLNDVIEKQLTEFTQERQNQFNELYIDINKLDAPTAQFTKLTKELSTAKENMLKIMPKIQYIEDQLPDAKIITNFYIKLNNDNTCSQDA